MFLDLINGAIHFSFISIPCTFSRCNAKAVSQQRWTGLTFSNDVHTTLGMAHMTGDKWSVTTGRGGCAVHVAMKCATCLYGGPDPELNQGLLGPVIDIFNASEVYHPVHGHWVVVVAHNASGEDAYGAVRAVQGAARLTNDTAFAPRHEVPKVFVGQLLMAEEWTPLVMVAGTATEFGDLNNFTTALGKLDDDMIVEPDHASLSLSFCDRQIDFFPRSVPVPGQYRLPRVDGVEINVDPNYTYSGPHLYTTGQQPQVVSTRFENAEGVLQMDYDFGRDEVVIHRSN